MPMRAGDFRAMTSTSNDRRGEAGTKALKAADSRQQTAQINVLAGHDLRSTLATAAWPEFREGPARKLAAQDASERADIAAAAKVETNHGTIIDEDETALPAHGWAIIVAGVSEHGDTAGTPPIVAEAIELLPGDSVEDRTLARSAAMAAWTVCEINATISESEIVALIPLSSNSDCDLLYVEHEVIYWKRNRTRYCDDTTGDSNTAKPAKSTAHAGKVIEMIDLNKSAVKLLEPRHSDGRWVMDTADQHCVVFNLA